MQRCSAGKPYTEPSRHTDSRMVKQGSPRRVKTHTKDRPNHDTHNDVFNKGNIMSLIQELQKMSDEHLTNVGPSIFHLEDGSIEINWSSSNDGYASITFLLTDTGNDEEERVFDLDISISNNDNVSPKEMLAQTNRCMGQFYELGLNTKFGKIVGE